MAKAERGREPFLRCAPGRGLRWLLVLAPVSASPSFVEAAPVGMARVPETVLVLGTDIDGLMEAAESCARRHDKDGETGSCAPDDLSIELSAGLPLIVSTFYLDEKEVSVSDYDRCVASQRCAAPDQEQQSQLFSRGDLPVVFVTYYDAEAFCRFRGARLPTEAEFEAAARGPLGRTYPWGKLYHRGRANSGRSGASVTDDRDGYELLAPVTSYFDGRSPERLLNLSGNAAEWTSTRFGPHTMAEAERPSGLRVVKGGSFADDPIALRSTAREQAKAGSRSARVGFRCARDGVPTSRERVEHP